MDKRLLLGLGIIVIVCFMINFKSENIKDIFNLDQKGKLLIQDSCKFDGSGFNKDHEITIPTYLIEINKVKYY